MWGDWNFKLCNKREGNTKSCNCDFQRVFGGNTESYNRDFQGVFGWRGLGLGFMVELNL